MQTAEQRRRREDDAPRGEPAGGQCYRAQVGALRREPTLEQDEHQGDVRDLVGEVEVVEVPEIQHVAAAGDAEPERHQDDRHAPAVEPHGGQHDSEQQQRDDEIDEGHRIGG